MAEIRFSCSGCGVILKVANPALVGKKLKCPKCAAVSVIPAPQPEEAAPSGPPPKASAVARPKATAPAQVKSKPAPEPLFENAETLIAPPPAAVKTKAPAVPEKGTKEKPTGRAKAEPEPDEDFSEAPAEEGNGEEAPPKKSGFDLVGVLVILLVLTYLGALGATYLGYLDFLYQF